ncbi:hypothetical protein J4206_05475 [Candidatus Woesearchaeota archaeon]|nr:hypothetical protein [Candidatus Woesearchaeota archaeon]
MKTLYVFGNEYLEDDAFAKDVAKEIAKATTKKTINGLNIKLCSHPEILLDAEEDELLILDVVKDIKKPMLLTNISQLKTRKLVSFHDFDVGFVLQLMKSMGTDKKIKIIGIPQKGDAKEIAHEVERWI